MIIPTFSGYIYIHGSYCNLNMRVEIFDNMIKRMENITLLSFNCDLNAYTTCGHKQLNLDCNEVQLD